MWTPIRCWWQRTTSRERSFALLYLVCMAQLLLVGLSGLLTNSHSPITVKPISIETQLQSCAPWMTDKEKRKVLFFRMPTMRKFYGPLSLKGGEFYVFACLDYALQQNGFIAETTARPLDWFSVEELSKYYRIFINDPSSLDQIRIFQDHPELFCKVRVLNFWGNWQQPSPGSEKNQTSLVLDPRQVLSPYSENYNTYMGFFVHSLLYDDQPVVKPPDGTRSIQLRRSKKGLIIGKRGNQFKPHHRAVMEALIENGFTLYSVCQARVGHCGMPEEVVIQRFMKPKEYADLMGEMAFLIGFGDPIVSPSPFEGLAHGAAWLNPIIAEDEAAVEVKKALRDYPLHWSNPTKVNTQHNPLALLGMPYVYNIDLQNVTNVLQAAQWAVKYRFSSYTPWEYRPEAMVARACGILEDDAICQCPNHPFNRDGNVNADPEIDCHGSTYVRNMPRE